MVPRYSMEILSLFFTSWATFVSSQRNSSYKRGDALRLNFDISATGKVIAEHYGVRKHPVTVEEVNSFDLSNEDDACGKKIAQYLWGTVPKRCLFGHNKTESDTYNLFFKNGWIIPTAEYKVENVTVLAQEKKNIHGYFERIEQKDNFRAYKTVSARKKYTNSIIHKNRSGNTFGVGVSVEVSVPGFGTGGSSLDYSHSWGSEETKTSTDEMEMGGDVVIVLEPFTIVLVNLSSYQEFWTFEVHYLVELKGHVIADYVDELQDHHFWNFPVESVAGGPRRYIEMIQLNKIESAKTQLSLG